jgi:hypothetical protein
MCRGVWEMGDCSCFGGAANEKPLLALPLLVTARSIFGVERRALRLANDRWLDVVLHFDATL